MWFRSIFNASAAGPSGAIKAKTEAPPQSLGQPGAALLSAGALRLLDRMCLKTGPLRLGQPNGSRSSHVPKPATDFREHRQYTPGDDVRYVDWKASARQEHIFIKQGEYERAVVVTLLIDCSASMDWGDPPKSRTALSLAAALGYLALAHNDRLVIVPVGSGARGMDMLRPLGPLWGKGQAPLMNSYLQSIRFHGQVDLAATLAGLSRQRNRDFRQQSQGGMILVISDLLGTTDLARGLEALPAPTWTVSICHLLHPAEISPAINGYFEMQDIETGEKKLYPVTPNILETYRQRLQSWQKATAQLCLERNAAYTMISTNGSIENEIIPQLQRDQVVKRL